MSFEETAMKYFRDEVGADRLQRIDGIRCFSPLTKFWFWKMRLDWLCIRGKLVVKTRPKAYNDLPYYGLPEA